GPRRRLPEAGLYLRDPGAPSEVERGRCLAVQQLEARDHPVLGRRDLLDRQRPLDVGGCLRQALVDRTRRTFAVGHGLDQVAGAEGDVSTREQPGHGRRQRLALDLDRPGGGQRDAIVRAQERKVGALAYGQDAGVGFQSQAVRFVVLRGETSGGVEDRDDLAQLDGMEPALAEEAAGTPAGQEANAFLLRLLELLM